MSPMAVSAGAAVGVVVLAALVPFRPREPRRAVAPRPGSTAMPASSRPRRTVLVPVAAAAALAGLLVVGAGLTIVAGAVVAGVVATRRRRDKRVHRVAIETAMPDAIELLVMCLHSGFSPGQAMAQLAREAPPPLRPAFDAVEQRLHRGAGFAEALSELTSSCGRCALPLVSAMSAAVRDGLPLAPVLDRLSDEAVDSRRRQGEAAARRLPVRLSFPLVVCTLPSFVLLAIAPAVLGAISSLRSPAP